MIIEICLLNDAKGKLWRIDIHFIDYRSTAYYVISLITLFFLDKMENIITRIHCIPYTPHLPKDLLSTLLSTAYLVISLIRRWSNMVSLSNDLPLFVEIWNLQLHNLWSNTSWTKSEIFAKVKLQKLIEKWKRLKVNYFNKTSHVLQYFWTWNSYRCSDWSSCKLL